MLAAQYKAKRSTNILEVACVWLGPIDILSPNPQPPPQSKLAPGVGVCEAR